MLSEIERNRLWTRYGPWAMITGASSGIGLELSERLAESGFNLVLNARNEEALLRISAQFMKQYGIQVKAVAADASTAVGINKILTTVEDLDIGLFIASAGFGTSGNFIQNKLEDEVNMLRLNCEALLILTHHFSQIFAHKKRGGIILMSSIVAFQGVPFSANYAATKAYVQSLAEALAVELKPQGVDVLAAAPGPVASGFEQRADMQMNRSLTPQQVGAPILKALGRRTSVLPGWLSKLLAYALRTVPRWGKVLIMKNVMWGMTKHQTIPPQ